MFSYYKYKVLPYALQYGMTPDQFWYDDPTLLMSYTIAYYRRVDYEAWKQGQYNTMAHSISLHNAFRDKKEKELHYPQWNDPMSKYEQVKPKVVITKDNIEQVFRESQIEQALWLREVLNKGKK